MHLPDNSKFQIYFDAKVEKDISFTYVIATTDTDIKNLSIENWHRFLSKNILQLAPNGIFHVEVNIK